MDKYPINILERAVKNEDSPFRKRDIIFLEMSGEMDNFEKRPEKPCEKQDKYRVVKQDKYIDYEMFGKYSMANFGRTACGGDLFCRGAVVLHHYPRNTFRGAALEVRCVRSLAVRD